MDRADRLVKRERPKMKLESQETVWRRIAHRERELAEESSRLFIATCEPIFWDVAQQCLLLSTKADRVADMMRLQWDTVQMNLRLQMQARDGGEL
jgi:hypothetical protein